MYDQKCFDLAEAFLSEKKFKEEDTRQEKVNELAQEIQDRIEQFMEEEIEDDDLEDDE